jgi:hypothetical protein
LKEVEEFEARAARVGARSGFGDVEDGSDGGVVVVEDGFEEEAAALVGGEFVQSGAESGVEVVGEVDLGARGEG